MVSTLRVDIGADGYDVVIATDAFEGDEQVAPGVARDHPALSYVRVDATGPAGYCGAARSAGD